MDVLTFTTPVPVGMKNVILKMESAQNRVYKSLPTIVKEHFDLTSSNYQPKLFKETVSFSSNSRYDDFSYAYCHMCSSKKNIKKLFWDVYPDQLPAEVSISNLMENWDKLNLSWKQEVLGCLLPNNETDKLVINAKLILRPEKHWNSVHAPKKNPQKGAMQRSLLSRLLPAKPPPVVNLIPESDRPTTSSQAPQSSQSLQSSQSPPSSTISKPPSKRSCPQMTQQKKMFQTSVSSLLDPSINFVGHLPKSRLEEFSLGYAMNTIHVGINAGISDETILSYQRSELDKTREYFTEFVKESNPSINPPRVTVNNPHWYKCNG